MGRLATTPVAADRRADTIAYVKDRTISFDGDWGGYSGALVPDDVPGTIPLPAIVGAPNLDYLADGDVVEMHPDGTVQVLYRRASPHNSILTTERCNSLCLMCSQPPRDIDDAYRVGKIIRLLGLIDPAAGELGLTGGEPTLLGSGLLDILSCAKASLPATAIHLLTNGRRFADRMFARRLAEIEHPDLMLGIPLYSDVDWRHDYVVQARGAYGETLAGLYNLARAGIRIQLRVVLHKQTVDRLPRLGEFVARNLPFVDHVALMGLEMFGFTPLNLDDVWIDPVDYSDRLEQTTRLLALSGIRVLIFNHQLCTIPKAVWPFAVRSISDWKNVYLPECDACQVKEACGGFFQSATKRHSRAIRAIAPAPTS
jgi:His-Xaa-Ser system radical SAM maturase HxsC